MRTDDKQITDVKIHQLLSRLPAKHVLTDIDLRKSFENNFRYIHI